MAETGIIGLVITLGALVTAVIKILQPINDLRGKWDALHAKQDALEGKQLEALMLALKTAAYTSRMPETERIDACRAYIKLGGNGSITALETKLIDQRDKRMRGIPIPVEELV